MFFSADNDDNADRLHSADSWGTEECLKKSDMGTGSLTIKSLVSIRQEQVNDPGSQEHP